MPILIINAISRWDGDGCEGLWVGWGRVYSGYLWVGKLIGEPAPTDFIQYFTINFLQYFTMGGGGFIQVICG
jgi:hypothetical protein